MVSDETIDRPRRPTSAVFAYRARGDGSVVISWHGRPVTTLRGSAAQRFLRKITGASEHQAQLVMAKVTGNFKRGNERAGKQTRNT